MEVHFLNCGTMHPRLGYWLAPHLDRSPRLCLLVEAGNRLVLVDAGFGTEDMRNLSRLGKGNIIFNAVPDEVQTALRGIQRLGYRADDVGGYRLHPSG